MARVNGPTNRVPHKSIQRASPSAGNRAAEDSSMFAVHFDGLLLKRRTIVVLDVEKTR